MCLYIRDKKPQIAKRDIVVLKYLDQLDGKRYESPCQGTPVTLGKLMVARPDTPYISYECKDLYDREISSIGGGVIHAKLSESDDYGTYCAKAIIPKGTEYWIDSFGEEIAARQMLITEEEGSNESVDTQLFEEILESALEKSGIRIGDYQMIDDSFVHPKKSIAKTKVRGIVCGFYENNEPIICALKMFREAWNSQDDFSIGKPYTYGYNLLTSIELFNGKEATREYIQKEYKNKSKFHAFRRCINYRKKKREEWFFGALGETMTMLDNAIYLNAAHKITGLGFIINSNNWYYWSCSKGSSHRAWYSYLSGGRVYCSESSRMNVYSVVPFYAFTNGVNKQK